MDRIPRGVEVLVKKASIDPEFRELLLSKRAAAAEAIGLALTPAETAMLNTVPRDQLEAIIARTSVHPKQRAAFLGKAAAVMIAALGAGGLSSGCGGGLADQWDDPEFIATREQLVRKQEILRQIRREGRRLPLSDDKELPDFTVGTRPGR